LALAIQLNEQMDKEADELQKVMEVYNQIIASELQLEENSKYSSTVGPGYWKTALGPNELYRKVPISSKKENGKINELYQYVSQKFASSGRKLTGLWYVQNEKLWFNYITAKQSNANVGEVVRFHGTPVKNVDGICEKGFLTSKDVSGRGTTIWSAEAPSYSVGYAAKGPAADGTHTMFLARVLSNQATISTVQNGSWMYPEYVIAFK